MRKGSILRPDLWNIAYDGLLKPEMPEVVVLVRHADAIAVLVTTRVVELAQLTLNQAMRRINR